MNLCKPPDLLHLTGNNDRNWREFKEQLQWYLEGTESTRKSDGAKLALCYCILARKPENSIKPFCGQPKEMRISLIKS